MKRLALILALVFVVAVALPALAGNAKVDDTEITLTGPHYNLNIHGVTNEKNAKMTGSNTHSIFVGLGSKNGQVTTRIYLVPPPEGYGEGNLNDFKVCDANGFDVAYNCAGEAIRGENEGATFQLPCNTNIVKGNNASELVPCSINEKASYSVWVRELGKPMEPGAETKVTTCAYKQGTNEWDCSSENVILVRNTGKSYFRDVTQELTSLVADDGKRYALFAGPFEDWFWQYDNQGLKLAQIRFYLEP